MRAPTDQMPAGSGPQKRTRAALIDGLSMLVFVLCLAYAALYALTGQSADHLALYAAATVLANGDAHLVYPSATGLFTVEPPSEWRPMMEGLGYAGELYPYIYPPLWAALIAPWIEAVSPAAFSAVAGPVNLALLLVSIWLAYRIVGPVMRPLPFFAMAGVAVLTTLPGTLALQEGQSQILVGVLVLLAIERSLAGDARWAGAALALAAALKGWPALMVLVWIGAGQGRAALWFAGIGAGLAGLSVSLAGWALHVAFLQLLAQIADTTILQQVVYGFYPLVMQLAPVAPENLVLRTDLLTEAGTPAPYLVFAKPAWAAMFGTVAVLGLMVGIGWLMRRASDGQVRRVLWPSALLWSAFFTPLPWAYCYIVVLVFLPALVARRPGLGGLALVASLALFRPTYGMLDLGLAMHSPTSALCTLALALIGVCFALSWRDQSWRDLSRRDQSWRDRAPPAAPRGRPSP